MLSMGPSPTWLLKLSTCQPMTLASCWTACTWCCDICEWKWTLLTSAWTLTLQWPDTMTVNFLWGFHCLAQEPYVMYEESSCVTTRGRERPPPSTAEAKTAWRSLSLSTGSLRTGTWPAGCSHLDRYMWSNIQGSRTCWVSSIHTSSVLQPTLPGASPVWLR